MPIEAKFRNGVRLFGLWKNEKIKTNFKAKLFQEKQVQWIKFFVQYSYNTVIFNIKDIKRQKSQIQPY